MYLRIVCDTNRIHDNISSVFFVICFRKLNIQQTARRISVEKKNNKHKLCWMSEGSKE